MAPPSIEGAGDVKLLEASWQGDHIHIRLHALAGLPKRKHLWIRIGQGLIETEVIDQQAADSEGICRLTVCARGLEEGAVFARATPIAIFLGKSAPSELVTDSDLSNPVYCINQPFLFEHLDDRPATARMRDIAILSTRLGHSSPALTLNVYSHALPATDQSETKRVAAALD